ncbi:MAG TPA: hemolysin III family protein [Syntrophaceticus sp.]|jgi:hemolysin III|uniref:Membrane protein, hemolysin III-like protein n=1 Tax=Syntrophaceticus schinkii TaxID=499207 RepID=A0A0B7MGZ0_9FIRM|nr:hemolysin III family protein [Syntrophaceticus schinkii]HHY31359.1 hemolysin III family protein [Syntrophaceticus sp.]MDD2359187.1 hemolysin III family protein [Syntrophaceticus schinkii]MDD4262346.1 hemolysin III family protein [Syntrophaceticus schinkii]MDD4674902.1 hemolysin III family protein [Syntrophaceticus schinkii]CEO89325.1 Membrane protein, hemolysin III-like protein [Syntrophaceticus schinkii]
MTVREPFNGFSHLFGAVLSVAGLGLLIRRALNYGSVLYLVAFIIFGISLILLYTASALYHLLLISEQVTKVLRYIDHMMIYILIAGTYTPICLISLRGVQGKILLISIWVLAVAGVIVTGFWLNAPRYLSTLIYAVMGWLIIVTLPQLLTALTVPGFAWLLIGGVFYTIGAIIYGLKRPNLPSGLGFHEIFHLFIIAGSICHYWVIFNFV